MLWPTICINALALYLKGRGSACFQGLELVDDGERPMKGFGEAVRVWRVHLAKP